MLGKLQKGADVFLYLCRRRDGRISLDGSAVGGDKELGEVPLDAAAKPAFGTFLEKGEDGRFIRTVHVYLLHHGEADAVVQLAEFFGRLSIGQFLIGKVARGKANHHQTLFFILLPKDFKSGKLRGESAFACRIDNQ